MIILHEINLKLHLLRKKKLGGVLYIVHYDAGLRFNFSLQVKYHCKIAKTYKLFNIKILFQVFFLSNTKMNKFT